MEPSLLLILEGLTAECAAMGQEAKILQREAWAVHAWMGIIEDVIPAPIPPPALCVLHCIVSLQTAASMIPLCATALIL